ncbi:AcuC Deacetylases, including yeast histone deacetylase and acetoin utilization protein [Comamonadaceae bacterium]
MSTPIFYDPRQSVSSLVTYSPSAGKPSRFVELVAEMSPGAYGETGELQFSFDPVTREDLHRVHSKEYVDGVFAGITLNGFENNDPRVPDSCLWTIGSLWGAAKAALSNPVQPICSPTSGFHHAYFGYGGGYCTFNGLMVVAAKLLAERPDLRIGILDCDFHYGDGTNDILNRFPELAKSIVHHTSGKSLFPEHDADEYFFWLQEAVVDLNAKNCDLVLYQAGADAHKDDPLGGILSTSEMEQRDRHVFYRLECAIAWNFAGGYQGDGKSDIRHDKVLKLHYNTLRASNDSVRFRRKFFA